LSCRMVFPLWLFNHRIRWRIGTLRSPKISWNIADHTSCFFPDFCQLCLGTQMLKENIMNLIFLLFYWNRAGAALCWDSMIHQPLSQRRKDSQSLVGRSDFQCYLPHVFPAFPTIVCSSLQCCIIGFDRDNIWLAGLETHNIVKMCSRLTSISHVYFCRGGSDLLTRI
jgi:hypothetical protein